MFLITTDYILLLNIYRSLGQGCRISSLSTVFQLFRALVTCSQNRQATKFQNHENINFVEKLYFFISYNQVYIAKYIYLGEKQVITKLEGK